MNWPRPAFPVRHGSLTTAVPAEVWLSDDPDLAMVHADMRAWDLAHPCDCHATCECDEVPDA